MKMSWREVQRRRKLLTEYSIMIAGKGRSNSGGGGTPTPTPTPDETAPTLSSPIDTASGSGGGDLTVTTDEGNGTLYWFVSTSATPPTAAALKAGTGAADFGSQGITSTGAKNSTAAGLLAGTTYYAHWLHTDAAANDSAIVSGDGFTTSAISAPVLAFPVGHVSGTNPPPFSITTDASGAVVGDYFRLEVFTDAGLTAHVAGSPETQEFTSAKALGENFTWACMAALAGGAYWWRLRAVRNPGGSEQTSAWSNTLTDTLDALGWTPESLWLASENGDWWDTNDLSTMFTDTAGTIQVTAVGQVVKSWMGKRGTIFLTSLGATPATLRETAGGNKYLEFGGGGSGSGFEVASAAISGTAGVRTTATAADFNSAASARRFVDADDGTGTRVAQLLRTSATAGLETQSFGTSNTSDNSGQTYTANTPFTAIGINRGTGSTLEAFMGNVSNGATSLAAAPRTNSTIFKLGSGNQMNLYGALVQIGRAIDATERGELHTYLADLTT